MSLVRYDCRPEYGDRTALFLADTSASLAEQSRGSRPNSSSLVTVLLADDPGDGSDGRVPAAAAQSGRRVQFERSVASIEDAITAVALNGETRVAIIRHDLPLQVPRQAAG